VTDDPNDHGNIPVDVISVWSPIRPHLLPAWWRDGPNGPYCPFCGRCGQKPAFYCDPIGAWRCWICVEVLIR
jgi:hypothetical protein